MVKFCWVFVFLLLFISACDSSTREVQRGEVVNIFSNALKASDRSLFYPFERSSGVRVNIIYESGNRIIQRLMQQQQDSVLADLVLLEGITYLQQAKQAGLLDTLSQGSIVNTIPSHLRDPNLQWLSLGYSANVIGYLRDSVDTLQVQRYADLANPGWKNKLGWGIKNKAMYQSQLASMIADQGEELTARWMEGVSKNMVDTTNYRAARHFAIADSSAWLGLLNTAEYIRLKRNHPSTGLLFPSPQAYLHIVGVGIAHKAPHPARASLLLNYLFSRDVMQQYADRYCLYPARPDIEVPARLRRLGKIRPDTTAQGDIARFVDEAERLLNNKGWR